MNYATNVRFTPAEVRRAIRIAQDYAGRTFRCSVRASEHGSYLQTETAEEMNAIEQALSDGLF